MCAKWRSCITCNACAQNGDHASHALHAYHAPSHTCEHLYREREGKHVRLDSEGGASLEEEIPFAEEGDADKVVENEAPQTKPRQSKVSISIKCVLRL